MADELGHLSAEIALDINPFLNNQRVLEAQINRTGKLLTNMENSFKSGASKIGSQSLFKTQIAQLKMLSKQVDNYRQRFDAAKKDLAANPTVDNQRALGTTATQLQNTALKYDQLRLSTAQALQQQRQASSIFGRGATAIGDYGNKLESAASSIKSAGSIMGSAAIGAGLYSAAQAAMHFKSEIQEIGPLLSDDGRITAEVTQQLNSMSASSLKWSQQYGISTHEINDAMAELARRGFTANQTLGSMPAILNASRASGESLGIVMQASASAIEMFGLKANTTAEQIKNTNRVTDVLTVAANKTASSFADISAAMTYVGPTASQAHLSIEQTAAAIGALSNKGIEASTAGTTLRQVLSKLTTDTKQNRANMRAIGVDIDEIKKKGVDLPSLIDHINAKLKDKTPTEKMSLLNAAFGKLGQGVMALFEKSNKASRSAGQELRDLENELYKAGGTTKRIADQMNQTPEAKWNQFKQTMHATLIEIGGNVLPAFTGLMKTVQNLAQAFGQLNPGTQKAIIGFLAAYAAIKPLSAAVAAPIEGLGKLENAFKKIYTIGAKIRGGSLASALKAVDQAIGSGKNAKELASGLEKVGSATTKTTSNVIDFSQAASKMGGAAAEAGTGLAATETAATATGGALSGLMSSLAATAAGLGVVAAAALVFYSGFKVWQTGIQPAINSLVEHSRETALWGAQVGSQTSNAVSKFKDFSAKATDAMNAAKVGITSNADDIKSAFNGMAQTAQSNADKTDSALRKLSKSLGGQAGASIDSSRKENNSRNNSYLKQISADQKLANQIIDNASKQGGKMSADTRQMLDNIQSDITRNFVKTLGTTKSASARIQQAIDGTFHGKLSGNQEIARLNEFGDALDRNAKRTEQGMDQIKAAYDKGQLSHRQYVKAKEALEKDDYDRSKTLLTGEVNFLRHQGNSWSAIRRQLQNQGGASDAAIENAINSVRKGTGKIDTIIAKTTGNMSKNARKAGEAWNKLVFDPKTGKIKTNAQQAVNDFAKTDKGWKQLKFIAKNAKISSNAKTMIAEAVFASGRWNSMSFKEQEALIRSKGGDEIAKLLYIEGEWNNTNPKIQELIATAKGKDEIFDALNNIKNWNLLTPNQKKIVISQFSGFDKLQLELLNIKKWNSLSAKEQKAVINTVKKGGSLEDALKKVQVWNSLPKSMQKEIKVIDGATGKIDQTKQKLDQLNVTKVTPQMKFEASGFMSQYQTVNNLMNGLNGKQAKGFFTLDADRSVQQASQAQSTLDSLNGKRSTSHLGVTGIPQVVNATESQKRLFGTPEAHKNNTMSTTGASSVANGTSKQKAFNGTPSSSKSNSMHASGRGEVADGTSKQRNFNGTHASSKNNHMHASGRGEVADATKKQHDFMGLTGHTVVNTIRTVVEKVTKFFTGKATGTAGAWRVPHFAYGTPNDGWEGGPVVVGDGHRREIVYDPAVGLFPTPATDTLMNLSKDSIVWRSVEAFESAMWHAGIKNYPHFANGTTDQAMVALANRIPDDADQRVQAVVAQPSNQSNETQMQTNELIATLIEQNQQLISIISNMGMSINVDGKQFANAQAENNSKAINEYVKQTGMRFS